MSRGRSGRGRAGSGRGIRLGSGQPGTGIRLGSGTGERDPAGIGHRGMGPKSKNKPGGKKAEKKEEEVKLNEGDEAEREEAARLEKEKLERERMARLEAKYQEQKESELAELNSLEQKFLSAQQWKMEYREHEKWEHYLSCDGIPDPTVPQQINTFMSLWREDQDEDVQLVMEKGEQVLNLIEKLQLLLMDTPPNEMTAKEAVQYQESILELQDLLHQKYNEATQHLLKCQGLPDLEALESKELAEHPKDNAEEPGEEEKKAREEPSVPAEEETCPAGRKKSVVSLKETSNNMEDVNETEEETEKKSEILDRSSQEGDPLAQEETRDKEGAAAAANFVDLQRFMPVGGVFHIDALQLPPQVMEVNDWTMVELVNVGLEVYPYSPEEAEDATESIIQITLGLPDSVVYFDSPVVARWDPEAQQWRTDGISNIKYEAQEKSITFVMSGFYTVALLQDAHLNMPYKAWELQPTGVDEALLVVTTDLATIQIQIKGNQCMLSSVVVEEKDVLSHITGEWMSPLALRAALKRAGVNIFPGEYSHNYVPVTRKAALAELKACQQMALVAPAFAFASSRWNGAAGPEHVVFKVREHLEADSVQDNNWSLYMFNGQKAQKLKITETSETFSEEIEEDSEFHSTLYHLLKDFASKAAMDKVEGASCLFMDVVYQLLLTTRVLTYS
ncbi:dynein axonemal intermediate chain 7 isoform X3 [Pseudopipra pipra]|uniref:dynein axonemal intermediate chain 7 isoform X3 n=1 Tax=Pseudopipra pipra TaxID=415032 RepID=UPI003138F954